MSKIMVSNAATSSVMELDYLDDLPQRLRHAGASTKDIRRVEA
jgi:hypothetical protein